MVVNYSDKLKIFTVINSNGTFVKEKRPYTVIGLRIIASSANEIQTGYDSIGGVAGFSVLDAVKVEELSRRTAERSVRMLHADRAPAGRMTVVTSSEAGGTFIHESIGHSLEADLVQKGISDIYAGKLGMKVASEIITVVDDATVAGRMGSFVYDDEGYPAKKNVLVHRGVLKNYMYDYLSAKKDNAASTGNGRRQSYRHIPIPRMTNTMIMPGNKKPQEIIEAVENGIYVKKMGGGQVDTANGNFVFNVEESYRIVKGKIGSMVRGAILIGNGPVILKSIDMVGDDLGFGMGVCGKDGQGVPVGDAQPTLRIPEITVGGTQL